MQEVPSPRSLIALFDSLQSQYPAGVPRNLVRTAFETDSRRSAEASGVVTWGNRDASIVIIASKVLQIGSAAGGVEFAGAGGELLSAALAKGMQLDAESVLIVTDPTSFKELCISRATKVALVLGDEMADLCGLDAGTRGVWQYINALPAVVSYDPAQVSHAPELKREFWNHLKTVMTKLNS